MNATAKRDCLIGLDQGSSSSKAVLIGTDGTLLFQTRQDLSRPTRNVVRVEQDPKDILASIRTVLERAVQHAGEQNFSILGIGLSCQRSSCLVWDKRTGDPLSPVLSWRDTRGSAFIDTLAPHTDAVHAATGLPLTPYYSASKFRWLRDNVPAGNTAVFGTLSSYLCFHLTGERSMVIDHTHAGRTLLMNLRDLSWDPQLLDLFGLKGIALPEIVSTAFAYGTVETSVGAISLLACIGDQQSAALGLDVNGPGKAALNYGTGGFLLANTGDRPVITQGLMTSVHHSSERQVSYLIEGSVNAVGDGLDWLRQRWGLYREPTELDRLCRAARTDVVVFLGLNGTGAPHWERSISSALHGIQPDSSRADIARAAVEGIAFFIKDIDEAMRAAGVAPRSYLASGGLAGLSYLIEAQSELLGTAVRVNRDQEASARGAAVLAGSLLGLEIPGSPAASPRESASSTLSSEAIQRRYRRWKALHRASAELDAL